MVEIELINSLKSFFLMRFWNLLWIRARRFWIQVKSYPASNRGLNSVANRRYADLDTIDIDKEWAYSKPIIERKIKDLIPYFYNMENELRIFAQAVELPDNNPLHTILPIYYEFLMSSVIPSVRDEPSGLVVVKLIVPTFFLVTHHGMRHNWFRILCSDVMRKFIDGYFEVELEDHRTYELREYMQQIGLTGQVNNEISSNHNKQLI